VSTLRVVSPADRAALPERVAIILGGRSVIDAGEVPDNALFDRKELAPLLL
jgi:hypothetical protein